MLSKKEMKLIHDVQMEMMDEIEKFCKKNNLTYFFVGGSALGAIRHNGFIPWDDDIDIAMMREDYDKFIKLYKDNDKYFLQCYEKDPNYWDYFAKFRKKNTLALEKRIAELDLNKEIFVDIFPFDNAPAGGYNKIKIRANIVKLFRSAHLLKHKIKKLSECNAKPLNFLVSKLPDKLISKVLYKCFTKDNNKETEYCVGFLTDGPMRRCYMKKSILVPTVKVPFEDKKYNVPGKCHEYLTLAFGDYMKLPPKEKRINHDILKVEDYTLGRKK